MNGVYRFKFLQTTTSNTVLELQLVFQKFLPSKPKPLYFSERMLSFWILYLSLYAKVIAQGTFEFL